MQQTSSFADHGLWTVTDIFYLYLQGGLYEKKTGIADYNPYIIFPDNMYCGICLPYGR